MTPADLFPRPRLVRWGEACVPADTARSELIDSSLPPEGYRLTVAPGGIELRHADDNGRRYGLQALTQLTGEDGVAEAQIQDHPDIAVRGVMLDISRDRVPTRETLELLVQRLAACRYNHLQLYTEHSFAYTGHDVVWADASPLTADDMRWLDQRCRAHGIELAANQNTFGHMERWLRHDAYRDRAETPEGFEQGGRARPPTALAPTVENAEFALGLLRELLATVSSRRVNIGCDEIWELGKGRSAERVAQRGRTAVFVEHLRRIAEPLLTDGYEVQFWADMIEREPEVGSTLARAGAIATLWGYQAPTSIDPDAVDWRALPEGEREAVEDYIRRAGGGFGPRLESFADSGFRTWVAPGTSGWNSFVGRHANARANISDAVDAVMAHGAEGILVTEWGDNGHIQPPFATLPMLAYGGASSWCRAANGEITDRELALSVSRHLLDDATGALGRCLIELASVADTLRLAQNNGSQLFYCWIDSGLPRGIQRPRPERLTEALSQVESATSLLDAARPEVVDGGQLLSETRLSARLVRHGLRRLALGFDMADATPADLAAELVDLRGEHRASWLARSRAGGLEDSLSRFRDVSS